MKNNKQTKNKQTTTTTQKHTQQILIISLLHIYMPGSHRNESLVLLTVFVLVTQVTARCYDAGIWCGQKSRQFPVTQVVWRISH